jgi:hypothetical protein
VEFCWCCEVGGIRTNSLLVGGSRSLKFSAVPGAKLAGIGVMVVVVVDATGNSGG